MSGLERRTPASEITHRRPPWPSLSPNCALTIKFGISTSPQGTTCTSIRDLWQAAEETNVFTSGWVNEEAIVGLLSGERVTMDGDHVQLNDAQLTVRGPAMPPICIGGLGEKRMLPLVARYADHWSYEGTDMDEFGHKLGVLMKLCDDIGRDPGEIDRSAKVRFSADEEPGVVAGRAQHLVDHGVTMVLVSFPRPLDAEAIAPIAAALSGVGR